MQDDDKPAQAPAPTQPIGTPASAPGYGGGQTATFSGVTAARTAAAPAGAQARAQAQAQAPGPGAAAMISDTDTAGFALNVIEASKHVPVIVDFWAPWCGPCKTLGPMLEKLVTQLAGKVRLVKVNIDENKELAQQMQVQSIPAVYGFKDGRPVDAFAGAQPESKIKEFIKRLTDGAESPVDVALAKGQELLDDGKPEEASGYFAHILEHDDASAPAIAGLIRCSTLAGDIVTGRQIVAGLTEEMLEHADIAAAIAALELASDGSSDSDTADMEARLEKDETDHQARFDLGCAWFAAGKHGEAIELLVDGVRRDNNWNDGAFRMQLLKIFEALGPADDHVIDGRIHLSAVLYA